MIAGGLSVIFITVHGHRDSSLYRETTLAPVLPPLKNFFSLPPAFFWLPVLHPVPLVPFHHCAGNTPGVNGRQARGGSAPSLNDLVSEANSFLRELFAVPLEVIHSSMGMA